MEKPIHEKWEEDDLPPPNTFLKRLSTPEAHELGEICLIRELLRGSYNSMRLYFDKYIEAKPGSDEFTIRMSLFRDAVVQFASCFTKDKGDKVRMKPEEVFGHLDGWGKMAKWFHDLRDFYAAHSFGPQRQHDMCAIMEWNDTKTRCRFIGIGEHFLHFQGPDASNREQILRFMLVAIEFVGKQIGLRRLALHQQMLKIGPDALYRYPDFIAAVPEPTEIRIPRHRFRTKRGIGTEPVHEDLPDRISETESNLPPDSSPQSPDSAEVAPPTKPESKQ